MIRQVALAGIVGFALVPFAQAQKPAEKKEGPAAETTAKLKDLTTDLKEARELLKGVADKTTRDRLELLLTRSELRAVELEKSLAGAASAPSTPPLSAEDFAKLMKSLKSESFDEGKASFVVLFAQKGRLTCEQAREILKAFSFDDDRVKSAVLLYPRVTDPENFFKVLDVFSFSSSKEEVRRKIGTKQ